MKLFKKNKFFKIFGLFLAWRVGFFLISILAQKIIVYSPSFPYANDVLAISGLPKWFYSWGNFDGVHYISIVNRGYLSIGLIQAFFPAYPIIIKWFNLLIKNTLVNSLVISNLSFLSFLYIWHLFIEKRYTEKIAYLSTVILLLFPTSFFFGAIYNESLFLLFVILTFWFAEEKKYLLTALFIGLASATRIVGIFLIPAVMIEIIFSDFNFSIFFNSFLNSKISSNLRKNKKEYQILLSKFNKNIVSVKKKKWPLFLVTLGSWGLLSYMAYLWLNFNDPLYFFHVQAKFGGIRQETLIPYPQVVYRYIKILLTARPFNLNYLSSLKELFYGVVGLVLILFSFSKVRFSYFIFALMSFILPTLTGTFSSMPRYILVCFPIYIIIAHYLSKHNKFKYFWLIISAFLLLFNTVLFIQGHWVA